MSKEIKSRIKVLPIKTFIPLDLSRNVRDPSGATMKVEDLQGDILLHGGLKVRPLVHFKGGEFDCVIQGYRRITSCANLHNELPHDKRWDNVEVEIFDDLDEATLLDKMIDNANTKPLEAYEVVRGIWMRRAAQPNISMNDLTLLCKGYLTMYWPPSPDKKTPDEIAENYRGTMQNICYAQDCPEVLQETYMDFVKEGRSVAYRKKDIAALRSIFNDEKKADPTGLISRSNPGPKFMGRFNEFLEAEAERSGRVKVKKIGSMSRSELVTIGENTPSLLVKAISRLAARDIPNADRILLTLGQWMARDIEPKLSDQDRKNYVAIMEGRFTDAGFSAAAA